MGDELQGGDNVRQWRGELGRERQCSTVLQSLSSTRVESWSEDGTVLGQGGYMISMAARAVIKQEQVCMYLNYYYEIWSPRQRSRLGGKSKEGEGGPRLHFPFGRPAISGRG